jgi:ketosteroid isomerase-like protein
MSTTDVRVAENRFFGALLQGSRTELAAVLAEDFMLIDVMTGSEIPRAALLDVVGSGMLRFLAIERGEAAIRRYGATAVVTGSTRMRGEYSGQAWEARSRYTHVYVEQEGGWRLVAAQGTPIAGDPPV